MGNKENAGEDIHQFDMVCSELDIICACYYRLGIVWVYFGQDGTLY
jgi:hypothetical protein